eukprot:1139136-Pleurochrysis_carterae.AAC.1
MASRWRQAIVSQQRGFHQTVDNQAFLRRAFSKWFFFCRGGLPISTPEAFAHRRCPRSCSACLCIKGNGAELLRRYDKDGDMKLGRAELLMLLADAQRHLTASEGLWLIAQLVDENAEQVGLKWYVRPKELVSARYAPLGWRAHAQLEREELERSASLSSRLSQGSALATMNRAANGPGAGSGSGLSPCFSDFSAFCSGGLVDIIADWVRDCAVAYSTEIALATGTAAAIEGFYSVFFSSPRVESRSFGVLHLVRALSNSAPHLYFLLVVMIREGIYMLEVGPALL